MASDRGVSSRQKTVKWITGFALLAGCLVAAMAYRTPAVFGLGPHGQPASKVEDILMMNDLPSAYKLQKGTCAKDSFTGGGTSCEAPWVYCTDANCDQNLVESSYTSGLLVAKCYCWMPQNTNFSIIPKETAGAGCVANEVSPGNAAFGVTGGSSMCDAMKDGTLISTYGPTGTSDIGIKIHAKAVKCAPKTKWAWCWGAPCTKDEFGRVICECPITISDWDEDQYVSVSSVACDIEKGFCSEEGLNKGPCSVIHNGSPAGESPMAHMEQCE